ncbi:MAG: hypothetical protein KF784_20270, partial [Fimbriimonadaceae bacterium]|nr:hypothetical protein [Fimbriimonadaceae bacterium]MBX3649707.1 hypothetical protein [Rhodocyclaceae bacterium]
GRLSPIALHQAVLDYDRAVGRVEARMLLLNIARSRHCLPRHFTGVSGVAAMFEFQATAGSTHTVVAPGPDSLGLSFGGGMAERQTMAIVPIQGEECTRRILTPFDERRVTFMCRQGVEPCDHPASDGERHPSERVRRVGLLPQHALFRGGVSGVSPACHAPVVVEPVARIASDAVDL